MSRANLLARLGEKFPLACPSCDGDIRLISFITESGPIRRILLQLGEPLKPPPVLPDWELLIDSNELTRSHVDAKFEQPSPDDLAIFNMHYRSKPGALPSQN